jgi:hypothetical protein
MIMVPSDVGEKVSERRETIDGWPIRLITYRTGDRYVCKIDNIDPGTLVARGEGHSAEEAERAAITQAIARATNSKRLQSTLSELRLRVAELDKRLSDTSSDHPPPSTRS